MLELWLVSAVPGHVPWAKQGLITRSRLVGIAWPERIQRFSGE